MTFTLEITVDDRPMRAAIKAILDRLECSERALVALRCWHRLYNWPEARAAKLGEIEFKVSREYGYEIVETPHLFTVLP